ncbi:sigma-54-dependent transcriptional regulator [Undibacterium curvum]|uniref:Sigma-54-dependent Fis family transcriptional regulator n=1 Tax=Undibacterium curvum TaxID=2762294 RepID=A0ABR7A9N9_9BURK|nr:sigma-54 dependent transcriptional regulator [Undibacterium curvum]MBC3933595.1 sigma-54-dependent Fis family transcriptional regulator [Undibacterium curvum]
MPTVLIIDDNLSVATALEVSLSLHDLDCVIATTPEQGLDYLSTHSIDLVIQDMNFSADTTSGQEGGALFKRIRAHSPDMPVILITAWTHLDMAVELIKAGAADYIAKPWDDQRLITTVRNLIELGQANRTLQRRNQRELQQKQALEADFDLCGLIWQDRATAKVLEVACQVARSGAPILITGPNGAGKERIAEIVQRNSAVCDGPFVILNCGALPAELIEAELFGSESGAYTGAMKAREGKFEAADGGTLFLDEIGNLPLAGQMKLLRVLETGRFQRLGANRERQVSVRIISATNADLPAMIKSGQFREDLYYRLNVIQLHLPALAARPDDILPLARAFLGKEKHLSEAACAALLAHNWPGNVRELKNLMQRVQLLSSAAQITAADLGLSVAVTKSLTENEPDKAAIEQALVQAEGVIAQAAAALGLSRQSLYRRMDRFGIPRSGTGST